MAKKTQKPITASFGATVAERRKLLDMSQESLAERVGISQESLSRMENGFIAPRFERLQLFAEALECSVADLFKEQSRTRARTGALERLLSPLSDGEQRKLVEVVAQIVALVGARHASGRLG